MAKFDQRVRVLNGFGAASGSSSEVGFVGYSYFTDSPQVSVETKPVPEAPRVANAAS